MSRAFTTAVVTDHNTLRGAFQQYQGTKNAELVKYFVNLLIIHSVAEELVWYPEIQRVFPGAQGQKIVAENIQEHRAVQDILVALNGLSESDASYPAQFAALASKLQEHLVEEETVELPNFEAKISDAESNALANSFNGVKRSLAASYPSAASLLVTPIDKVQSLLASLPAIGNTNK